MNYRRRRPKKQPACCMCTQHRWKGNAKSRFRLKDRPAEPQRSRKRIGPMTLNQEIRSLEQSLVHDVAWHERFGPVSVNDFMNDWYDEEQARIEKKQARIAKLLTEREELRSA